MKELNLSDYAYNVRNAYSKFVKDLPDLLKSEFGDEIHITRIEECEKKRSYNPKIKTTHHVFFDKIEGYLDARSMLSTLRMTGDVNECFCEASGTANFVGWYMRVFRKGR